MGKHGPCYHCGVTSTPLWRNGPPDKPVLCNACGSRWRTKGTLTNYTPLHSRAPFELEESKTPKLKFIYKKPKERKLQKVKQSSHIVGSEMIECVGNSGRDLDEETSNRSSSGSAVSYSESCAHFGGMDMSDITGSAQSNVRDSDLPSHNRMFTHLKPSHVEKLTKDLHYILHQQSSYFSRSSEDDLLYDNGTPTGFVEIGHGGVLIRNSDSVLADEESEASSLLTENKSTHSALSLPVNIQCKGRSVSNMGSDNFKSTQVVQENIRRDNSSRQKFHIQHRDSDLGIMDLKDVVNFEVFMKHLTPEEQQHLMRYLPTVDTDLPPKSLGSMFSSIQFEETYYYFQQLIQEGVFDLSFCANSDDCRTLKKLVLLNLKKFNWIERYRMLKDANHNQKYGEKGLLIGNHFLLPSNSASLKRPRDIQHQDLSEPKVMKSPMRMSKAGMVKALPTKNCKIDTSNMTNKSNSHVNDSKQSDGSCFSQSNQFAFPSNISSILDPLHFSNGKTDQDLLLDVRSNLSFPQAELLSDFCSRTIPVSFSAESEISGKDGCLSSQMSSSVGNKHVGQW